MLSVETKEKSEIKTMNQKSQSLVGDDFNAR